MENLNTYKAMANAGAMVAFNQLEERRVRKNLLKEIERLCSQAAMPAKDWNKIKKVIDKADLS